MENVNIPTESMTKVVLSGELCVIDGNVYVDGVSLANAFRQFHERQCFVELTLPDHSVSEYERHIAPLIHAMRARGVRTVASCEGHITPSPFGRKYPWVEFATADLCKILAILGQNWTVPNSLDPLLSIVRHVGEAKTQEDLEKMWKDVEDLTQRVQSLLRGA